MEEDASFRMGEHPASFVAAQMEHGRYSSPSNVACAALRLLEEQETRLSALQDALAEGEQGNPSTRFDFEVFIARKREA